MLNFKHLNSPIDYLNWPKKVKHLTPVKVEWDLDVYFSLVFSEIPSCVLMMLAKKNLGAIS